MAAYYKPTVEHMEQEYLKAVPFLTISEAEQARRELTNEKEEHERAWKDTQLELLMLKERERERDRKEEEYEVIKADYGERIARLEEKMMEYAQRRVPPEAQIVPQSMPRAGTSGS